MGAMDLARLSAAGGVEEATTVAKRHLLNVSYLRGNEELKYEVIRIV